MIARLRKTAARTMAKLPAPPADTRIEPLTGAPVGGEWVRAAQARQGRVLLYFHGGGYFYGSPRDFREMNHRLSAAMRAEVLAADYRIAPPDHFPAAYEDALALYRWLLDRGTAPGAVVLGGDSAGGGLALALLAGLRAEGLPAPAAACLFSPWTDLAVSGGSVQTNAKRDPLLTPEGTRNVAAFYLGGASARDPRASPLYADLSGLPPLLLQVGSDEILLDDSRRVAEAIESAGDTVRLDVWPRMFHVWHLTAYFVPEARRAIAEAAAFADAHFG